MRKFMGVLGMDLKDREPDVAMPAPSPQRFMNLESFLAHDAPAVRLYQPDLEALRAARARIAPAVGRTSVAGGTDRLQHAAPARALAAELGLEVFEFPGGHGGYGSHPRAFAARLREVLGASGD